MPVRFLFVQVSAFRKGLVASCSIRRMLNKGARKLWRRRTLSMFSVLLLLSYTLIALVGTFLIPEARGQESSVTMWVTPPNSIYEKGDTFSVTIWLNDTADEFGPYDVKGWGLTINFDGSILQYVGAVQGTYLKNYGNTFFTAPPARTLPVSIACLIVSGGISAEGPGDLVIVTFRVVGNGRASIDLKDTELVNSSSAAIPQAEPVDGLFYTTYPRARFYYLPSTGASSISGIFFPAHLNRDPLVNETVTFNATAYVLWGRFLFGSYDPDTVTENNSAGAIVNYAWDFDGNVTSGDYPTITHSFSSTTFHYVNLTVTDEEGKSDSFGLSVSPVIHDVAVLPDMEITPQATKPGGNVSITVAIENMGTFISEYANVTLFSRFNGSDTLIWYDQTEGKSAFCTVFEYDPITLTKPRILPPGERIAVNYTWSTTGLPEGQYLLWANASLVDRTGTEFLNDVYLREMESNSTNNLRFGGIVTLTETALPPVAYLIVSPFNPVVGTPVTFDATFSYDPDGKIVSYGWDFGDGQNGTGMVVTHVYSATGTYFATLTVTDQDNLHGSMHAVIVVVPEGPEPPTSIYVDPEISLAAVGETFTVDVGVQDVEDLIGFEFWLQWDTTLLELINVREGPFLNSSGLYQTYFSAKIPGDPYFPFTDRLYALDVLMGATIETSASGSGVLASATFRVLTQGNGTLDLFDSILVRYDPFTPEEIAHTVQDGYVIVIPGQLPIAMFTYSPSEPAVNQTVTFDASASYDPNGTIVEYQWTFGDGSPPISMGEPYVTYAYNKGGNFTVTLTVTDNDGLTSSTSEMIVVVRFPSAISISASPVSFKIGESTTISGAISPARAGASVMILYRPQGSEYWGTLGFVSTNENGEYSYEWHRYYGPGTYELKATWSGDDQYEGSESEIITVNVLLPQPTILIFPAQGSVGAKVEVYGGDYPEGQPIYLTFDDQLVGFLYTDEQGNLSASFNVPLSAPGLHKIKAWAVFYYGDMRTLSAEASFMVIDLATLDVTADVGSTFFKQDTAEFYVQTALKGVAVDATTINARLRKPDGTEETLVSETIGTGLYLIRYLINGKGSPTGTYTLIVEATYESETLSAHGTTIKTFLVKPPWERELPRAAALSVASIGLISAMILVWRKEKRKFL